MPEPRNDKRKAPNKQPRDEQVDEKLPANNHAPDEPHEGRPHQDRVGMPSPDD